MSTTPTPTPTTRRLWIPHPFADGCTIAGDLEQHAPDAPTVGRPVALILHGTMGHKDYLFQKRLAKALPLDSLRFDFRGNHETGGVWKMGKLGEDVDDLRAVVAHLTAPPLGYVVALVVGHSRGSVVAMRWLCTAPEAAAVRGFVNVSGRYRMERIHYRDTEYASAFAAQGFHEWRVTVARTPVVGIIRPEDVAEFAAWDNSLVWTHFPQNTHVLTLHGLSDGTVPPFDALIYASAFGARPHGKGTHNLHLLEDADHNFTGRSADVVEAVIAWWATLERGELRTGVWRTGFEPTNADRGKL